MKIILYSTHCPMCNVLEKKLQMKNIEYDICTDINEIRKLGFLSAPILKVDDDYYTFKEANILLNNIEETKDAD